MISNLTNTLWEFNDVFTNLPTTDLSGVKYDIIFSSNSVAYSQIIFVNINSEVDIYYQINEYESPVRVFQGSLNTWANERYKIISVITGDDIQNVDLIQILTNNATLKFLTTQIELTLTEGVLTWTQVVNADYYNLYKLPSNEPFTENVTSPLNIMRYPSGTYQVRGFCYNPDITQDDASTLFSNGQNWEKSSTQNIALHPYIQGEIDEDVTLYPKTTKANIVDMTISDTPSEDSSALFTAGGAYELKGQIEEANSEIDSINDNNVYQASTSLDGKTLYLLGKLNGEDNNIEFTGGADWGQIQGNIQSQTDLQDALNNKVDKVAGSSLMTSAEHDKLSGIENGAEVNVLEGVQINNNDLTITNKKVNIAMDTTFNPSSTNAAQSQAIANFVNSSISSNTAYFLGTYNLVSDLSGSISDTHSDVGVEIKTYLQNHPPVGGISNNDYVFIQIPTADNTPTIIAQIDRYKYNSEDEEWLYEYTLNNSGFTAAQWAAINSGIDATKVSNYDGYASTKQDTLVDSGNDQNIKTINGNSILGSGNITTYAEFNSNWATNSTTLAFCQQVNGTASAVVGTAYLGSVSFSDMPTGVSNGELVVEIIPSSAADNGKAIHLILTSGSISPYRWEYTYWEQNSADHYTGWIGFQNKLTAGNNISIAGNTISAVSSSTNKFVTAAMYEYLDNQLYQAPSVSTFALLGTIDGGSSQSVSGTFETGSTIVVNAIRHKETNINNIDTLYIYFHGVALESITKSASTVDVNLSTPQTITSDVSSLLKGTNTKGNTFSKGVNISFTNYAYSALVDSTTAPTTQQDGLTKQSVDSTFRNNGASFNYHVDEYLYLYTTSSSATTIQTQVIGDWADVNTTSVGQVTITKANGTTGTYYCFRTTSPFSANGTATYRVV